MITAAQLALLKVQIRDELSQAFRAQPPAELLYPSLALNVGTTAPTNKYFGLGARPGFKKLEDRMAAEGMKQYPYQLTDDEYYDLITIQRKAIEDDATGQYLTDAKRIGEGADLFREQNVIALLMNGRTGVCYDGQPYFNGQHQGGVLNAPGQTVTQSNVLTLPLTHDNVATALGMFGNFVDDKGNPFGALPDTLLVGSSNLVAGSDLLRNDVVGKTTLNSILSLKVSALVPGGSWFLLATKGVRPLIRQYRTDIGENGLDLNDNIGSKDAWFDGEWGIGARVREAFGYGPWWAGLGSFV